MTLAYITQKALALLQKAHVVLPLRNDVSKVVYIWQDYARKEMLTIKSVLSKWINGRFAVLRFKEGNEKVRVNTNSGLLFNRDHHNQY